MILLGVLSFTFCYLFVTFLNMSAENQVRDLLFMQYLSFLI